MTTIEYAAFTDDVDNLISIYVDPNNPNYKSINGLLLSKDERTLIHGVNGIVAIPDGVRKIEKSAFEGCKNLTSITIPIGVSGIFDAAFWGCSGLTSVIMPYTITTIEKYAFHNCTNIRTLTIGEHV